MVFDSVEIDGPVQEIVDFSTRPELPGVQILSAKNVARKWRTYHDTYTICMVRPGQATGEWQYRERRYPIKSGDLMLMEPGELHVTTEIKGLASFQTFFVEAEQFYRWSEERGLSKLPHFDVARLASPSVFCAFIQLEKAIDESHSSLAIESHWLQCLDLLFGNCLEQQKPLLRKVSRKGLVLAKDYLIDFSDSKVSLEELAAVAGISRYHFLREFKRVFGLPPHAYLNEVRLSRLRKALSKGVPLKDIAGSYFDDSHVHYHFKRSFGLTPKQYVEGVTGA